MKRKAHLKVKALNEEIDLHEFLKALQVPEIHKIIYHQFEELKVKYHAEITGLDQVGKCQEVDNIVPLNREVYYPLTIPEKLKRYFKTVLDNTRLQDIVLDDFESVYIPMLSELRELRRS